MKPEEIISQLETLARSFGGAVLCVAFPDRTGFLFSREESKLEVLTQLIAQGASPVAFLHQVQHGQGLEVVATPLKTVENAPGIGDYLETIIAWYRGMLAEDGLAARGAVN